jgi:hypothetical protein
MLSAPSNKKRVISIYKHFILTQQQPYILMKSVHHVLDLRKEAKKVAKKEAQAAGGKVKKGKKKELVLVEGCNFFDLSTIDGTPDLVIVENTQAKPKNGVVGHGKREMSFKVLGEPVAFAHAVFNGNIVNPNNAVSV